MLYELKSCFRGYVENHLPKMLFRLERRKAAIANDQKVLAK